MPISGLTPFLPLSWLTKEDVVNTLPLKALMKELSMKRAKAP